MNHPYRIVAKVQNNRLWRAVKERFPDVANQNDAAQRLGLSATDIGQLLNMKVFPAHVKDGRYHYWKRAIHIAEQLGQDVDYLFDPKLYDGQVPSTVTVEVGLAALTRRTTRELPPSPEDEAMMHEREGLIRQALQQLTPRQELIIRQRFGLDGQERTCQEIGQSLGISGGRVQQIEQRALWKLRHPTRNLRLRMAQ